MLCQAPDFDRVYQGFRWVVLSSGTLRPESEKKGAGMQCDQCAGEQFTKAGRDRQRRQLYRCRACGRRITARSASALSGYRFPDDIIALTVGWYVQYPRYCCNQMGSRMADLRMSKGGWPWSASGVEASGRGAMGRPAWADNAGAATTAVAASPPGRRAHSRTMPSQMT